MLARNLRYCLGTAIPHHQLKFALQDFQNTLDPCLAESSEAPQKGAADADGPRPKRQGLKDVRTAPETSIDEYRDAIARFGHDFG